jgi:hypothetical protein
LQSGRPEPSVRGTLIRTDCCPSAHPAASEDPRLWWLGSGAGGGSMSGSSGIRFFPLSPSSHPT